VTHTLRGFMVRSAALGLIVWCAGIHEGAAQSHPSMEMPGNEVGATALTGKVVETMNSGGYTYVLVDDGTKKTWAAGPPSTVAVGDQVIVANGMPMHDFTSKTLGRTFDVIYFAPGIQVVGAKLLDHMAAVHGMASNGSAAAAPAAAVDLSNIKKADGGQTIAELFANKAALAGKPVIVRGRVVKFTPAVMGKNWVHPSMPLDISGGNRKFRKASLSFVARSGWRSWA